MNFRLWRGKLLKLMKKHNVNENSYLLLDFTYTAEIH